MAEGIPASLRPALLALGDAVLPIEDWLPAPGSPTQAAWNRRGRRVSIEDLRALDVIDRLIRSEDPEVDDRWASLDADPVRVLRDVVGVADVTQWRKDRRLTEPPKFRMDPTNWPTPVDGDALAPGPTGAPGPLPPLPLPVSRPTMYAAARASLEGVYANIGADLARWFGAATAMLAEDAPALTALGWTETPALASRFLRTFVRDLLIAATGMKNVEAGSMEFALLEELREGRRVGNAYARADVDASRGTFEATLTRVVRP